MHDKLPFCTHPQQGLKVQDEEEEAGEEGTSPPPHSTKLGGTQTQRTGKVWGGKGAPGGGGGERVPMCKDSSPRATARPTAGSHRRRGESVSTGPRGRHSGGTNGG